MDGGKDNSGIRYAYSTALSLSHMRRQVVNRAKWTFVVLRRNTAQDFRNALVYAVGGAGPHNVGRVRPKCDEVALVAHPLSTVPVLFVQALKQCLSTLTKDVLTSVEILWHGTAVEFLPANPSRRGLED